MNQEDKKKKKEGITRREFIQHSAAAGVAFTLPGLFAGCSNSSYSTTPGKESRTYYFDLSHGDPAHTFHLKAGATYMELIKVKQETLATARNANPMLSLVPDSNITHYVNISFSFGAICLCWIVGEDPKAVDGSWNMPLMFFHIPQAALEVAARMPAANPNAGANKFALYGSDTRAYAGNPRAYLWADEFKNWHDQATALVFSHQEMVCGDPNSAAYIQNHIISPSELTSALSKILQGQGPAAENGGWATQEVYIDPDTGKPYLNSQGQKQYFTKWSQTTLYATGAAVSSTLQQVKDDYALGANITNMAVDQENPEMQGKIWKVRDGITTVQAGEPSANVVDYTFSEASCKHGYHVEIKSVSTNGPDIQIEIQAHNWYVRYLGLYIRYLTSENTPISVADLPSAVTDSFPSRWKPFNGTYDNMALMMGAELEMLGIPLKSVNQTFNIIMPSIASKVQVLAGGIGMGSNKYADTLQPGVAMTAMINICTPAIFLSFAAATGYNQFVEGVSGSETRLIAQILLESVFDAIATVDYDSPNTFISMAQSAGTYLLSKGGWLAAEMSAALSAGDATDAIPIIGCIAQAIAAAGIAAALAQTVAEVCRSPKTYAYKMTFTHDITVTICHDPKDTNGFPATATQYQLLAFFDSGTPWKSGSITMPGGGATWTQPLSYTFKNAPYGGNVKITVGFYSGNNWLAGQGSTGIIENDKTAANVTITITENKVPLQINTLYSHKEKTILDADGNLVWLATTEAPTANIMDLNCGNQNGDLCEPACITVSEHFAAAGYSWRSCSDDVQSCDAGAGGQLFQFANMNTAQDPESGHETSGCGFSNLVRIVYDLMDAQDNNFYIDTTEGNNLVRQIRLNLYEKPDFDGPHSNICWGAFNCPSDALMLHPSRKLISINSEYNKIEVLSLPDVAGPDNEAPLALIYSATGTREGLISGPVCGAVSPDGAILILESVNQRIQAFDLGGNPAKRFGSAMDQYYAPLKAETSPATYLDMAVEYMGYIYVLSYITQQGLYQYRLDIYTPEGDWLCRTTGVNASKLGVDLWRNAYMLNYETLKYPNGSLPNVTEPSVSQWIPSTP